MAGVGWSAGQYTLFERQRTRPARDLFHAVPAGERWEIVDLGCSPGNSTAVLVERFPDATVTGLDSSEDMLAQARRWLPQVRFETADIATWSREGSGLRPYLARLEPSERPDFLARYQKLIERAYPPRADGKVLLAFPRLFIVATC